VRQCSSSPLPTASLKRTVTPKYSPFREACWEREERETIGGIANGTSGVFVRKTATNPAIPSKRPPLAAHYLMKGAKHLGSRDERQVDERSPQSGSRSPQSASRAGGWGCRSDHGRVRRHGGRRLPRQGQG